jgi:hypothetical protein
MSSGFYSSYLKILNPATGTALTLTSERNPVGRETIALKTVPGIPNIEQATANIPESAPAVEDHRRKKKKQVISLNVQKHQQEPGDKNRYSG